MKQAALILALFSSLWLRAAEPVLSPQAKITVLTCSPGAELYSLFGHSAVRVADPALDIDVVFNYGTFSFTDDFYYNFIMGRLAYKLSVSSFEGFMHEYQYEGRGVVEQVLDLDSTQKQRVMHFLDSNVQPENRVYLYDFFYDNCSSRILQLMQKNFGGAFTYPDLREPLEPSFRDLIDRYLVHHPWGDFGIDLGLGLPCDAIPSATDHAFLPDNLHAGLAAATIGGKPLVASENTLLPATPLTTPFSLSQPIPLFWIILGLIAAITAIERRRQHRLAAVDAILFVPVGLLGLLLCFLWFITDHQATANNFNLLWAWPTHVFVPILYLLPKVRKVYFVALLAVVSLTLLGFSMWPQNLHAATVPLTIAILIRAAHYLFPAKKLATS